MNVGMNIVVSKNNKAPHTGSVIRASKSNKPLLQPRIGISLTRIDVNILMRNVISHKGSIATKEDSSAYLIRYTLTERTVYLS